MNRRTLIAAALSAFSIPALSQDKPEKADTVYGSDGKWHDKKSLDKKNGICPICGTKTKETPSPQYTATLGYETPDLRRRLLSTNGSGQVISFVENCSTCNVLFAVTVEF